MELPTISGKLVCAWLFLGTVYLSSAGCAPLPHNGSPALVPQEITLDDLSTTPERFSGRVVSIRAFGYPVFGETSFERIQLWDKNADGACTTAGGRSYSVDRGQVRGLRSLPVSEVTASQIELVGTFHHEKVMINPGMIEFHWDGYFTNVKAKSLSDTCLLR